MGIDTYYHVDNRIKRIKRLELQVLNKPKLTVAKQHVTNNT